MNCNTCRYELSQCLDGRLPSGRRALVLAHAETCTDCGAFWKELQAAQELTLSLQPISVGDDFRASLWERIHAGEGTPEAVFHEPVPTWTKVRYALTGAAAAAAVLVGATLLKEDPAPALIDRGEVATAAVTPPAPALVQPPAPAQLAGGMQDRVPLAHNPLISAAKPLTFDLVALETARQLEQRYAAAAAGVRMMRDPSLDQERAIESVLENVTELRTFGEVLLDLRNLRRLEFTDEQVDQDLRFAVRLLAQTHAVADRSPRMIDELVTPALTDRLGTISRAIMVRPSADANEELDTLLQLNVTRPDVFPKLFVVLGNSEGDAGEFDVRVPGVTFLMMGDCGPSLVAPRSELLRNHLRVMVDFGGGR